MIHCRRKRWWIDPDEHWHILDYVNEYRSTYELCCDGKILWSDDDDDDDDAEEAILF